MNHLLRPWIWPSFSPSCRLSEPEAGRPRVFLRQAQDKLTLRRTVQVRLGSNTLRLRGGTPASPERAGSRWRAGTSIFTVSRQQFMKHPGLVSVVSKGMGHGVKSQRSEI
jgi:hypothetical protein